MITKPIDTRDIDLYSLIEAICSSKPTEAELIPFIRLSVQFSLGYLRYKCKCGYRITETYPYEDKYLERMAVDAIADLFERDFSGNWIRLRAFYQPCLQEPHDPEEWISLTRKLVTNRTRQFLFQVFRDRDPATARIYRGLKRVVSGDKRLEIIDSGKGPYLTAANSMKDSHKEKQDPLLTDSLMQSLHSVFRPADTLPVLIEKLFRLCREQIGYFPDIPVSELVKCIKEYRNSFHDDMNPWKFDSPEDGILQEELEKKVESTLRQICEKIDRDYIKTGKIEPQMGDAVKKALELLIQDYMMDNIPRSYIDYIRESRPDIAPEIYHNDIRTRFEYFVRLLKNDIKEFLVTDSV